MTPLMMTNSSVSSASDGQPPNTPLSRIVTSSGIVTLERLLQFWNAILSISFTPGIVTLFICQQLQNAAPPMLFTEAGTVTLVIMPHEDSAFSPIRVTVRPPRVSGIASAPSGSGSTAGALYT